MSDFVALLTDASLWELATKERQGSFNFCPLVESFQVRVIMQAQLNTLSMVGVWGDSEKPRQDMAFLLIALSLTVRCKRVFHLTAVWAHPHQACFLTLEGVAHKLVLLADDNRDWLYAFLWLNNAISHAPLSNEVHISAMTDDMPSTDACDQLHQLQVCKLLQHKDRVVCPEGLNSELEALQFTFQELPLWDTATPRELFWERQLLEINLGYVQPEGMTTAIQAPATTPVLTLQPPDTIEPSCGITMAINLHLQGALEWLQRASSTASNPVSQCSMLRRVPTSVALGAPPSTEGTEDLLRPKETNSAIPIPMATLTQTSQWVTTPGNTLSIPYVTHSPLHPTMLKTQEAASMYMFPPGSYQPPCQINFFHLRRKWMQPWSNCS